MKFTRFLLGICCAAAVISSCSKAEKVSKEAETHPMSITLNLDEPTTKVDIAYSGTKYTPTWKAGDAISVVSIITYDVEGYNDKFELVSGAGTKTGVFHCATSHIPTTGTARAKVLYPYSNVIQPTNWLERSIENQGTGSLDNLGNYALLYAGLRYEDGVFDGYFASEKPQFQTFFFKLPAGLQLIGNSTGTITVDIELSATGTTEVFTRRWDSITLNSASSKVGTITLSGVTLTDGKLVSDTYFSVMSRNRSGETYAITVKQGGSSVTYDLTHTAYSSNGNVYKLSQTQFTPVLDF
ncbi:MAG: hypothetical protein J6X91_01680 [Bacteroidales bacterium]|nr:hypothetical protein [Bacteroidales bacterium]